MPKAFSPQELDALVQAVASSGSAGMSLAMLLKQFPAIPRRSLQRRLAYLVDQACLKAQGNGPVRRYLAIVEETASPLLAGAQTSETLRATDFEEAYIPVSDEGAQLRARIRQPLSQRVPVGYRRGFLESYVPNQTFYLPATLRKHLYDLGCSPASVQPAGTYARQIMDRLLVDLSWASSRLEGNTYSRLDTQNLIEFGRYADGHDRLEAQMILNHKAAIEMLIDQADGIGFNRYTVQNLHALLADNLLPDAGSIGRLRHVDVAISGTVYQPTAIPQTIAECFDMLLDRAEVIADPFEQAFFVMVHLPYLQPFEDVNKRVSRLAANIPLIQHNLAPLSFVDVPVTAYIDGTLAIYELNRVELLRDVFAWAYERSCQRYTLLKQALPEPDSVRLRYREELAQVIGTMVRSSLPVETDEIRRLAQGMVAADDMNEFIAMTINELLHLHMGNIARYRLKLSEFQQWQGLRRGAER